MYSKIFAKSVRCLVAVQIGGLVESKVIKVPVKLALMLLTGLNHLNPTPIEWFRFLT